ncbi:predicted protein [Streptomyces sp. SPB78]|nr:predicted protein [Streptomyces sp. SPB78]
MACGAARVGCRGPGRGEAPGVGKRFGGGRGPRIGEGVGRRLVQLHRARLCADCGRGRLAGGGPLAGFGLGEEQDLRLPRGPAGDDLCAAMVLGGLRRRVDLRASIRQALTL